jgi:hypothetical protein
MKLRKRNDGELADLVIEYTRKAARALQVVQDVQREQARRDKAQHEYFAKQEKSPWPCGTCAALFTTATELAAHVHAEHPGEPS